MSDKRSLFMTIAGSIALLLISGNASAAWEFNLPKGVTPTSHQLYDLHMLIFWVCVAIGLLVYGLMAWSIYRYRKSKGAVASDFHENTTIEVVWTVIPFIILIAVAVPATATMFRIYDTSESELTIKITGYQWRWGYDYLDYGFGFVSSLSTPIAQIHNKVSKDEHYLREVDNPLVLPTDTKIRFVMTSADVIHAWWVPAIGFKRDAVPGFIADAWAVIKKPGVYRGQCAELCGRWHAFMPIVVKAKTPEEFDKWVATQTTNKVASKETAEVASKEVAETASKAQAAEKTWNFEALMAKGKEVYNTVCAACHQANGQGLPGTFPSLAGSKVVTGPVEDHLTQIIEGSPEAMPPMQPFGPMLSDVEIAAVATYERNSFGNDTGDAVKPSQVKEAR